jgi:DNA-directed RNA polymerase alpha subunit
VGKILSLTRSQLSAIDQLGLKSIKEIEEKITDLGYKLKEE